jgi:hypothetical protein
MKQLIRFGCLAALIYLQSCGGKMIKNDAAQSEQTPSVTTDTSIKAPVPKATTNLYIKNAGDLIGYWVGKFEPDTAIEPIHVGERNAWDYSNKINISIDVIKGDTVNGHSVVAGNNRPFTGIVEKDGSIFRFSVQEPGDDKYDGKFKFSVSQSDSVLIGTWKANNKIRIPARKYVLVKKLFRYDAGARLLGEKYVDWNKKKKVTVKDDEVGDDYDVSYFATSEDVYKFNASTDLLTKYQVANMKKADLFILRNSIYARHGYSFKNQQLRAFFDKQYWYIPVNTDIKSEFTDTEKKNIELLLRYEKNAKEYYDVFGRG